MTCLPMKCAVELTEPEKKTLQQLSLKHPHEDFRTRGLGLLELGHGRRVHEIAIELDVSDKSVYNWVHAWKASWSSKCDCYVLLMKRECRTGQRQKAAFCLRTSSANWLRVFRVDRICLPAPPRLGF
jgi:hypothetical protein